MQTLRQNFHIYNSNYWIASDNDHCLLLISRYFNQNKNDRLIPAERNAIYNKYITRFFLKKKNTFIIRNLKNKFIDEKQCFLCIYWNRSNKIFQQFEENLFSNPSGSKTIVNYLFHQVKNLLFANPYVNEHHCLVCTWVFMHNL